MNTREHPGSSALQKLNVRSTGVQRIQLIEIGEEPAQKDLNVEMNDDVSAACDGRTNFTLVGQRRLNVGLQCGEEESIANHFVDKSRVARARFGYVVAFEEDSKYLERELECAV